jgi:hypothetical protein
MMLRRGQVCLPGPDGPVVAHDPAGAPFDPFDVVDRVRGDHDRLYLVDLDGIERRDPQLAYLQELSRDISLWVDAGVPSADAAIDILVAGAEKAVLSTAFLRGPAEIRRAWKLSTDLVFEVEVLPDGGVVASPKWPSLDPVDLASSVRSVGITDLVLSPREQDPDWSLVARLAAGGPTWVDGSFSTSETSRLRESGAAGGIYHLDTLLSSPPVPPVPEPVPETSPRDDED